MKWFRPGKQKPALVGNQNGVALLFAMVTIIIVAYLASELSYETNVEYLVNAQELQRVKAYYAARAGMELSLLRIKIYGQVSSQLSGQAKGMVKQDMIDMIWKMPFAWPPVLPTSTDVDKDLLKEKIDASAMDAGYTTTISDEGTKLNLNDLNSPAQTVRDITKKQLVAIFKNKIRDDEEWARNHQDLRPDELVNSIQDWVSFGRVSANGGDKASRYSSLGEGYPPNRAFRTVDEMRLVPGMTEDAFELLRDQVTVFGMGAINPNQASKDVLMALDPSITSKIADQIIERRTDNTKGGEFKDANDFWNYVSSIGARVDPNNQQNIPIICDSVFNFKIVATGAYKNTTSEITAIVFDLQKTAGQTIKMIQTAAAAGAGQPPPSQPAPGANPNNSASKGPPRIVYWNER